MRFKNFLHEMYDYGEDPPDDDDDVAEATDTLKNFINAYCPGLLRRLGNKGLLYRGVNKKGGYEGNFSVPELTHPVAAYRRRVRKDRQAMSTHPGVSRALDKWFEDNLGFRARSQAVFCAPERGRKTAEGYGSSTCIVFPVGKFSYAWSPNVEDLYQTVDQVINVRNKIAPEFDNGAGGVDMAKLDDYMKQFKYTNNNIDQAMSKDVEIMIDCDEVLLVQYRESQLNAIKQALGVKTDD